MIEVQRSRRLQFGGSEEAPPEKVHHGRSVLGAAIGLFTTRSPYLKQILLADVAPTHRAHLSLSGHVCPALRLLPSHRTVARDRQDLDRSESLARLAGCVHDPGIGANQHGLDLAGPSPGLR